MKWSIPLGHWLGIPVKLHVTFLLLLGFLATANWLATGSLAAAAGGAMFFAAIFGCVLLHEFGHALMARHYGVGTRDITLLPIGGVARLERMPEKPVQEFWIALAGPAVNLMIAAVLALWLLVSNRFEPVAGLSATSGGFLERLLAVNVFLILFNLLPAFPMDGGRVLRSLLAMKLDFVRATNIAGRMGQGMAVLFAFVALFWNPFLLFIALFVWMGASQEISGAQARSALAGMTMGQAMVTDYRVLTAGDRLGDAVRLVLAGSQQDFPVMDHHRVTGLLDRKHLLEGLSRLGPDGLVSQVMCREFPVLQLGDSVEAFLERHPHVEFPTVPVVAGTRLVGLFTMENLSELMLFKSAVDVSGASVPSRSVWPSFILRPPPLPESRIRA